MAKVYFIRENVSYFGADGTQKNVLNNTMYETEEKANTALMKHLEKIEADGWISFYSQKTEHNVMVDSEANTRIEYGIESYTLL